MAKYKNSGKIWQYTEDLKTGAVVLSLMYGVQVQRVAAKPDIHAVTMAQGLSRGQIRG